MTQSLTEREVWLHLKGVHKYYGDLHVLDSIDIVVHEEEIVTILGPSGCGKTTLLRILNGLIPHDAGDVLYKGEGVTGPRPEMAMVFQHFGLFPWKRLSQNIGYGLNLQGLSEEDIDELVDHYTWFIGPPKRWIQNIAYWLNLRRRSKEEIDKLVSHYTNLVGLEGFENNFPAELSGGMQQRAGLARALATQADVLLLDEPFGALDALTREQLQDELLKINEAEPKAMIFITHSIDEALLLGDRVLVMTPQPGEIRFEMETGFGRGRDLEAIRGSQRFQELRHYLWELLRNPGQMPDPLPEESELRGAAVNEGSGA
jgi:NitT/TauT family transport system ATP-binding protein